MSGRGPGSLARFLAMKRAETIKNLKTELRAWKRARRNLKKENVNGRR